MGISEGNPHDHKFQVVHNEQIKETNGHIVNVMCIPRSESEVIDHLMSEHTSGDSALQIEELESNNPNIRKIILSTDDSFVSVSSVDIEEANLQEDVVQN